MHDVAEYGIAAHWVYKSGEKFSVRDIERFTWLKQIIDWQQDFADSTQFYEALKLDLFAEEVFVFTPRGEVKEFPRGATPIDFAYRIHSEVGHRCAGAKVNGKIVPLKYKLQNGDTVEIITSDNQKPSKDWLKIAVTSNAKSKIRSTIKSEQREMARRIGEDLLEKDLRKSGFSYSKLSKDGTLKNIALKMDYNSLDEYLHSIGYGKDSSQTVIKELMPEEDAKTKAEEKEESFLSNIIGKISGKHKQAIKVGGVEDVLIRFGKCCNPLPGDDIVGFVTRGRGITVHRANCYKVLEIDAERKVAVEWDAKKGQKMRYTRLRVISDDVPGLLAEISKVIAKCGANISNASISTNKDKKANLLFEVALENSTQLYNMIKDIEKLKGIISVERSKAA
jgi:GTP pyrophosphokinase